MILLLGSGVKVETRHLRGLLKYCKISQYEPKISYVILDSWRVLVQDGCTGTDRLQCRCIGIPDTPVSPVFLPGCYYFETIRIK